MPFSSHPRYIQGKLMFLLFLWRISLFCCEINISLLLNYELELWVYFVTPPFKAQVQKKNYWGKSLLFVTKRIKTSSEWCNWAPILLISGDYQENIFINKPLLGGSSIDMNVLWWSANWKAPGLKNVQMAVLHLLYLF